MGTDSISGTMDRLSDEVLIHVDEITRHGFGQYKVIPPKLRIELGPRAQASCIFDFMMAEAGRRFSGRTDVRPIEMRGLQVWAIEDHTLLRFKKMDPSGMKRNFKTKQALNYDYGDEFPEFPPQAVRLTVGYVSDGTSTEVERVQIAYQRGRKIEWCAAIVPAEQRVDGQRIWQDVTMQPRLHGT